MNVPPNHPGDITVIYRENKDLSENQREHCETGQTGFETGWI